jgi:F-type H+-transporting ATPase subunit b
MSRRLWFCRLALIIVAVSIVASPALAVQETEHAEPSIFEGGLHNAVWTLLIFLTVVIVLGKFAWGPLLGALRQREDFIRDSLETAKREREESAELLKKYTDQISRAREEATAITQEGRRDAEEVRKRIQAEARAEADAMIKRAKREILIAHQDAIKEIYNAVAELSTQVAERILKREIDAKEHRDLINAALEEVKKQDKLSSN